MTHTTPLQGPRSNSALLNKPPNVPFKKKAIEKKVQKCFFCQKDLKTLKFSCRCGKTFCITHRTPEKHKCSFDFRKAFLSSNTYKDKKIVADKLKDRI